MMLSSIVPEQCRSCRFLRMRKGALTVCVVQKMQCCERTPSMQLLREVSAYCSIVNGDNNCSCNLFRPKRWAWLRKWFGGA